MPVPSLGPAWAGVWTQAEPGLPALLLRAPSPSCGLLGFFVLFTTPHPVFFPSLLFWAVFSMARPSPQPVPHLRQGRAVRGVRSPLPLCPVPGLGLGLLVCCWGFVSLSVRVRASTCLRASVDTLWSWGQDPASGHPRPFVRPLVHLVEGRGGWLVRGVAAGCWRSTLVTGDLGPRPPLRSGPRIRHWWVSGGWEG